MPPLSERGGVSEMIYVPIIHATKRESDKEMTTPLIFITDPGHGWLEVDLAEFPEAFDCGTGYGYIDEARGKIYLEEDTELWAFLKTHPEINDRITEKVWADRDAPLRNLPRNEARLVRA